MNYIKVCIWANNQCHMDEGTVNLKEKGKYLIFWCFNETSYCKPMHAFTTCNPIQGILLLWGTVMTYLYILICGWFVQAHYMCCYDCYWLAFLPPFLCPSLLPLLHPPPSSSIPLYPPPSSSILLRPPLSSSVLLYPPPASSILFGPPLSSSVLLYPPPSSSILFCPPLSSSVPLSAPSY